MKPRFNKTIISLSLSVALASAWPLHAQEYIQIEPLFEYPTAPESLTSLVDKSNYLIEHFWDAMDFKSTAAVDQNALNDAMKVYSVPIRWADLTNAEAGVDKLIEKISKNPTLLTQFTKAAEEILYGPRAEFWVDGVYMKFLEAYVRNKKIPAARKSRYEKQLSTLRNSTVGKTAPTFEFTGRNGKQATYMPMSTPTIMIFGNPEDTDWRMTRLKMETNVPLRQAVDQGKLNILYLVPFKSDNWEKETSNYPSSWTVGEASVVSDILDLRGYPSVYLIGGDGNILLKNVTVPMAVNEALKRISQ